MKINHFIKILFLFAACSAGIINAQFRADLPHQNIHGSVSEVSPLSAITNMQNFQMHHSFSMSMMNWGGSPMGVGTYTNFLSLNLSPKFSVNSQISFIQPALGGMQTQGNIFYGLGLSYQATEHSFFHLQINNFPTYYQSPNQHFQFIGH